MSKDNDILDEIIDEWDTSLKKMDKYFNELQKERNRSLKELQTASTKSSNNSINNYELIKIIYENRIKDIDFQLNKMSHDIDDVEHLYNRARIKRNEEFDNKIEKVNSDVNKLKWMGLATFASLSVVTLVNIILWFGNADSDVKSFANTILTGVMIPFYFGMIQYID